MVKRFDLKYIICKFTGNSTVNQRIIFYCQRNQFTFSSRYDIFCPFTNNDLVLEQYFSMYNVFYKKGMMATDKIFII